MVLAKDELIIDYKNKNKEPGIGTLTIQSNRFYLRCKMVANVSLIKAFQMLDNPKADFQELKIGDVSSGACFLWMHWSDVRLKIRKEEVRVDDDDPRYLFEISLNFHETKSLYLYLRSLVKKSDIQNNQ